MIAGAWLSSGNLAPYAATLENPAISNTAGNKIFYWDSAGGRVKPLDCGYIVNYDHHHYEANFRLVQGRPQGEWEGGWLLRRILFYLLAWPFTALFGFMYGGFIASLLLTLAAVLFTAILIRQFYSKGSAIVFLFLMALYPGIYYWIGLPYAQVTIVPAMLLNAILLYAIEKCESLPQAMLYTLGIGLTFLAYDLFIFILPALVLMLLLRKKWLWLILLPIVSAIPLAIWAAWLNKILPAQQTENLNIYPIILQSYFNMTPQIFWQNLIALPGIALQNLMDANFAGYVWLLIALLPFIIFTRTFITTRSEAGIWFGVLFIFLFNNMAPYYEGWPMRGAWIARIYQPMFVVIVWLAVRTYYRLHLLGYLKAAFAVQLIAFGLFLFNALVVFGPAAGDYRFTVLYEKFYHHSPLGTMQNNIEHFGARPLGVCAPIAPIK